MFLACCASFSRPSLETEFQCGGALARCSFFLITIVSCIFFFFFQAEDGIRDLIVTGVQTCALPIYDQSRAELERRVNFLLLNVQAAYWNLYVAYVTLYVNDQGLRQSHAAWRVGKDYRSEEHTSELQSRSDLVCRLLLEKKKQITKY